MPLGSQTSVADPGCLSRIPDPDFYPSRIPDPGSRIPDPKTATKERGEKKLDVNPFSVATKFNKIVNYFSFEVLNKKIWANFQRIIELFIKKIVKKLFKIWSWDPGSRIQGSKRHRSRIPDPDPQHCHKLKKNCASIKKFNQLASTRNHCLQSRREQGKETSIADPDPFVFGPPGEDSLARGTDPVPAVIKQK
jgi:hypothetical protein